MAGKGSIDERLLAVFGMAFELDSLDDDLSMETVEEWDSLAHMALIGELEHEFGVSIPTTIAAELTDVGRIREFLVDRNVE